MVCGSLGRWLALIELDWWRTQNARGEEKGRGLVSCPLPAVSQEKKKKPLKYVRYRMVLGEGIEVRLKVQTENRVRSSWVIHMLLVMSELEEKKHRIWILCPHLLIFYSDIKWSNVNFPLNTKQTLNPQFSVCRRFQRLSVSQWFSTIWFPVVWAPTCLPGLFAGALLGPENSLIPAADHKLVKGFLSGLPPYLISFHRQMQPEH